MDIKKKRKILKPNAQIIRRTLVLMIACGIVAFAVLAAQLYKIQIQSHDLYQSEAVEQQVRETTIHASRGTIYDKNMQVLAMSASVDTVYISPIEMLKYEEDASFIALRLSEILGVSYESIMAKWEDTKSWYKTVAVKIEKDVADRIRAIKNEYDFKSIHIVEDTKRYYPFSSLASQIIGFVGTDNNGLYGMENYYEKFLHGVNGRIVRATTSEGTDMLFTKYENYYDAVDGNSLVLTLDSTIQYYLEKHMEQAIRDYNVKNGAMGIVMDVKTGAVLGMATLPDYDLNNYSDLNEEDMAKLMELNLEGEEYQKALNDALFGQWKNRVIADTYEPGSTFKIITLSAALEDGIVNESSDFYCGGSMEVKGRTEPLKCWRSIGHGSQTLAQSAQHSCNVAFVTIGLRIGAERFYDYIRAFGFMDETGVDMGGEGESIWWKDSVFKNPDNLSSLGAASFGQTFNITPLQLITAVSAVANGGNLMEPYVVQQIIGPNGDIIKTAEPVVVRQVISEETSEKVCAILESVVADKEGTGKNAYVDGYRIAGKTGTSENIGQGTPEYIVSFVGFAPADDPKIAVLVLLDSPSRDTDIYISGGRMAAPVVGNIFADILPYIGVEPVYNNAENASTDVLLPNVKNLDVEEAKTTLKALGFEVKVEGSGTAVNDQIPMANVYVAQGSTIILYAGEEKPADTVVMPGLLNMSYTDAKSKLNALGLYIRSTGVSSSGLDTIIVQRQDVEEGTEITVGSVIQVTLIDNDSTILESAT